jgi:E3 ubiquitin-protein ligase RNF14
MMEDERKVELDCISAIFPEIVLDPDDPFSASIELLVNPTTPVKVVFPASSNGALCTPPATPPTSGQENNDSTAAPTNDVESHNLSYLPSLKIHIILPQGYPEETAPKFELSTSPEWLSRLYLDELQDNGERMWEEAGRNQVIFGYIDSLQQAAENAFGFAEDGKILEVPQDFMIALLDYDIKATQAAFEKETFHCGVCLGKTICWEGYLTVLIISADPKKGSACHRMIDCGHVFCAQCLQDFYNNAINEGYLVSVRCLAPDCAKKRAKAQASSKKHRKPKTQLSPSELLQIPLEHDMVTRYVKLKHKSDLESDKNTIYCPRKWCQGAARSEKHRKPDGFEVADSSDEESDTEENGKNEKFIAGKDLLAVCEDCSFAFCSRCYQGWHGEFTLCTPKKSTGELTEEDKASLEYLKLHTTPCPTCAAPAQKTHGCNHMICPKCNSHFCYLCSAWLEPANPYKHYNLETTGCFMRLWELEGGDGDDVGIGYAGGRAAAAPEPEDVVGAAADDDNGFGPEAVEVLAPFDDEARDEFRREMQGLLADGNVGQGGWIALNNAIPVPPVPAHPEAEREGPLILRINQAPHQPAPAIAPVDPDPPRAGRRNRGPAARQPPRQNVNPRQQPGAHAGRRVVRQQQRPQGQADLRVPPAQQEAAHQAWVQMFVQMALNDEEDQLEWDSDDEEDAAAWEIPVR